MFRSSHISFLVFDNFWQPRYENTKIFSNPCLHFARQDGQDGKKWKENQATKVTKFPKTKRQIYGMNKTVVIKIFYPDICKKKISPPLKIKKYLQNAEKFAHFFFFSFFLNDILLFTLSLSNLSYEMQRFY